MKTALLLACTAAALPALDVRPQPGLDLDGTPFSDLRVVVGIPATVEEADAGAATYTLDAALAPRLGVQWVRGTGGPSFGFALGLEAAYDDHRGHVARQRGFEPGFGAGDTQVRAATLGLLPKLILRPDFADPFDWGPGSVQVEIGPVVAAGVGWARVGGSPPADPAAVVRWGARLDLVFTTASRWQIGASVGWEAFAAEATWEDVDGSLSGSGLTAGLVIGRRL